VLDSDANGESLKADKASDKASDKESMYTVCLVVSTLLPWRSHTLQFLFSLL
jgi:hypothetical protein